MIAPEIEVRLAKQDDLNFIFSCWLRSYRHASQFAKKISNDIFYKFHHKLIEGIIIRGAQIRIAHPVGDPDTILGFSCLEMWQEKPVVHFVYIKKAFRNMGIAKKLVWETEGFFTHLTENLELYRHPNFLYNPYLV